MKVTRIVTGFFTVALLALVVGDAFGQDDTRRRGGDRGGPGGDRGGFGGGGFGGGRGGPGTGGPGGPGGGATQDPSLGLLRIQEVREEIEMLPDQEEALQKINEQSNNRERTDFDFRNASEEERNAFMEKMQKQAKERMEELQMQLEEVLLPEQMDRLKQLGVQAMGVRALTNEEVAKKLEITSKQKEQLDSVSGKVREQMMEMFRSGDRENAREKMEEMRKGIETDLLNVLTADQKKKFEEMKGEPFEFPEGATGRGPGGPGGGPGGPGGGRGGPGGDRGGPGGDRGGPGTGRGGPGGGFDRQRPAAE